MTIVHKDFTLEILNWENQQIEELYCSYYIAIFCIVITTMIVSNSQHHPRLFLHHVIYIDAKQH